jgi:Flp pilus assembly protein TadG
MKKTSLKESKGQSIIEFALLLPILLLVVFGITEFGRAIMTKDVLHTASREGARLAAVSSVGDSLSVKARVVEVLQAASIKNYQIFITTDLGAKTVEVEVTTDFEVLSRGVLDPFIGTFTLRGKTVMRYEG